MVNSKSIENGKLSEKIVAYVNLGGIYFVSICVGGIGIIGVVGNLFRTPEVANLNGAAYASGFLVGTGILAAATLGFSYITFAKLDFKVTLKESRIIEEDEEVN